MHDLRGKVAVVTGGASGIGLALAQGAQARGAKVVIADVRDDALAEAERLLAPGGEVLAVRADVSAYVDVAALAEATRARFGGTHLLINNAGVFASGLTWEVSLDQYDWVIGVNQRSVIHGIKAFVPAMIAGGEPCHVVTVASGAGITVNPGFCSYSMTKHAVVALTEALYLDLLTQRVGNVGITIVMPGVVQSQIMVPEKTGAAALQDELRARRDNPVLAALEAAMRVGVDAGLPREELVEQVYRAVANRDLYVLPNFDGEAAQAQARAIALGRITASDPYPSLIEPWLATTAKETA
jgi:NAD(P)-dependent dehydrogenase (short-subunit alcohol dehydrogenase family)